MQARVIDELSGNILFSCSLEKHEQAYLFAKQMEELGIRVQLQVPSITDTLAHNLGVKNEALESYQSSVEEELHHHDGRCCK